MGFMMVNYSENKQNAKGSKTNIFRPLATHIAPRLGSILRKKGGFGADLVENWPQIVGETMGKICLPFKIKSATLFIACEGFACLKIQHQADEIIKKINLFLGIQAIDKIKIVQKSLHIPSDYNIPIRALNQDEASWLEEQTELIEDSTLRTAMIQLGKNIIITAPCALKNPTYSDN